MPRVLFLGIRLNFYFSLWPVLIPQFGFHLGWGSVSQALVEPNFVPPLHPLKRSNFHLDNIIPPTTMDELVLVRAVNVFSQCIVIGIPDSPGKSGNPVLGKSLVVDNADIQ